MATDRRIDMTVQIQAQLSWVVFQDVKSKRWIGVCDPLRITVGGKSQGELLETIDDALQALMLDLVEKSEFDKFLRERGWRSMTPLPTKVDERTRFDIPMDIHVRPGRDYQDAVYQ